MPKQENALGVFIGSEIGDLNRDLKSAIKRLVEGDESAIHDVTRISRKRIELLKPKSMRKRK